MAGNTETEDLWEGKSDISFADGSDLSSVEVDEGEPCTKQARIEQSVQEPESVTSTKSGLRTDTAASWSLVQGFQSVPKLSFEADPGPRHGIVSEDPLSYFRYFMPDAFLAKLAEWTNEYAGQKAKDSNYSQSMTGWIDLDPTDHTELLAFLGIHFHLGLSSPPEIRSFWSKDTNFEKCQGVCDAMSYKRFTMLNCNLHCNSLEAERRNSNLSAEVVDQGRPDRLIKVRPLLNMLREKFVKSYVPAEDIANDESVIGFKGRLAFLQYTPLKQQKEVSKCGHWLANQATSTTLMCTLEKWAKRLQLTLVSVLF